MAKAKKVEATAGDIDPLMPTVQGPQPTAPDTADFGFAVNRVKLGRALSFVNAQTPGLKGKALAEAVKARYVEIGGLLIEDKPVRTGTHRKGMSHDTEEA